MVIQGNQLGEYVNRMIKRMGFENAEQMFFIDQLWRTRFSGCPLPQDYYHSKDCHLLELDYFNPGDCHLLELDINFRRFNFSYINKNDK